MSSQAAWVWIPISIFAAAVQTARNAAQRSLVAQAGTWGATLSRFLFGLPFAIFWLGVLERSQGSGWPAFSGSYFAWIAFGAAGQLTATAALLAAMKQRNFVVAVAYSKTDALQVAGFGLVFLQELPGWVTLVAILTATAGVVMLSVPAKKLAGSPEGPGALKAWLSPAALYGLASGACFAISAVGYRGASLQLHGISPWLVGAWGVVWAQAMQSAALGGWLSWKSPASLKAIARAWRISMVAGSAGAIASIGWFTSFALTSAANVRALGMVEVVFSYAVSHRLLQERLTRAELAGLLLVGVGLVVLCAQL